MNKKYLLVGFGSGVIAFILLATLVFYLKFGSGNDVHLRDPNQNKPQIHLTDLDLVDLNGTAVNITKYFEKPILLNFGLPGAHRMWANFPCWII